MCSSGVATKCDTIVLHTAFSRVTAHMDERSCFRGMGCRVSIALALADSPSLARLDSERADAPLSVRGHRECFSWALSLRPSVKVIPGCLIKIRVLRFNQGEGTIKFKPAAAKQQQRRIRSLPSGRDDAQRHRSNTTM